MTYGERLKILLKFKGITQHQFSEISNINESQLSKLINDKRRPSAREIESTIKTLNISYDMLLGKVEIFDLLLNFYKTSSANYLW